MLLALILPFASQAQTTLTVHEGTATNDYVPAYIYYFDDFTRSQVVYPAADLVDMAGGTISEIKFYTTSAEVPYTTLSTVNVYMKEVDYTTMTTLESNTGAELVYTGTLNIVTASNGGEMTITLTSPFSYNGGNLLVGIENTTDAGWKHIYFYGETVNGASWSGYNGSSLNNVTGTQRNFIPKTTFTYVPDEITCYPVRGITAVDSLTTVNSVTLNWMDTNNANVPYSIMRTAGEETAWFLTAAGDSTYTFSNLQPNTSYTFAFVSRCSDTDSSRAANYTVRTLNNVASIDAFAISGATKRGDIVFDTLGHAITVPVWYTNSLTTGFSMSWTLSDHADGMYVDTANDGSYTCKVTTTTIKNYLKMRTPLTVRVKAEDPTFYADYTITLAAEDCVKDRNLALTSERIRYTATWNNPDTLVTTHYFVNSTTRLTAEQLSGVNYVIVNNAHEYTVEGLNRATTYYAYLKAACDTTWLEDSVTTKDLGGCMDIVIGNENSTNSGYSYPVNPWYKYSLSETIIDAEELGGAQTFTSIRYYFHTTTAPSTKTDVAIYIQPTQKSVFTSNADLELLNSETAVQVYSGSFANFAQGWNELTLATPYEYDGLSNLMIIVDDNSGSDGSNSSKFRTSTCTGYKTLYWYSDSYDPDPTSTSYSGNKDYATSRVVMSLGYCLAPNPCPDVTNIAVDSLSHDFVRIEWTASDADYCVGNQIIVSATELDSTALANATGAVTLAANATSYDATGLTPDHDYYVYIKALCNGEAHNEGVSGWAAYEFRTEPAVRTPRILATRVSGKHTAQMVVVNMGLVALGQPTNYDYIVSTTLLDAVALASATPTATGIDTMLVNIDNLNSDTKYYFYFRNVLGDEVSPWSEPDSVTMPVAMPAVLNQGVYNIAHNAMIASWMRDDDNFADETAWRVAIALHGTTPAEWQTVTSSFADEYGFWGYNLFLNLITDTAYDIYVAAYDAETGATSDTVIIDSVRTAKFPGNGIVVADGTATNANVPVWGNWLDDPQRSQSIYPAEMLTALQGKSITAMRYYATGSSFDGSVNQWADKPFTVSLKITEQADLATAWADTTGATVVYTGDVSVDEGGMMVVTFAQPFTYTGGNLLVSYNMPVDNSGYKDLNFYGITAQNASRYVHSTNLSTAAGTVADFLPKVMFDYVGENTCLPVNYVYAMEVTDAIADMTWYPGNEETAWQYVFSTSDSMTVAELEAAAQPLQTNNITLTGLVRDTSYTFYIRPVCSDTETGNWTDWTFETPHVDYYYDVTVAVNDGEMGEAESLTQVFEGTDTILVAVANPGYHFVNWTMGETVLGTEDTLEISVDSNMAVMANFASDIFHVTFAVNDTTMGTITPAGVQEFEMNDEVTITATPNMGFHLAGWMLTIDGEDAIFTEDIDLTYTDTVDYMWDNATVTAIFAGNDSVSVTFGVNYYSMVGTITPAGMQRLVEGTEITVTATPLEGYHLEAWHMVLGELDTIITEDIQLSYTDTVEAEWDGVVINAIFAKDAPLPVEATIAASDIAYKVGTGSNEAVVAINWADTAFAWAVKFNGSITVQAAMDTIIAYDSRFNYTLNGYYLADITFAEDGDTLRGDAFSWWESKVNNAYGSGLSQALANGDFAKWAQPVAGVWTNSYYDWGYWMDSYVYPMAITPMWAPVPDSITMTFAVNDATMGSISPNGVQVLAIGETVTITATPNEGYHLASWHLVIPMRDVDTTVDAESTMSHPDTVSVFLDGAIITANFEADAVITYSVTVNVNDATMGHVEGVPAGAVAEGTQVTLRAVANPGYVFDGWSDGETAAERTITVNEDVVLTANFKRDPSGIDNVEGIDAQIYSNDNRIIVKGAENMNVYVYDVNGRCVSKQSNASETIEFTMQSAGVYLVKVGMAPAKRVVVVR